MDQAGRFLQLLEPGSPENSERSKYIFNPGFLERPSIPPDVNELKYRLVVAGKAGCGKSSLISWLAGQNIAKNYIPTPGVQSTVLYCPCRISVPSEQVFLFTLQLWEVGAAAYKTYSEIVEKWPDSVDCVILLFSYTEKETFQSLPKLGAEMEKPKNPKPCLVAVALGWNIEEPMEVTQKDIREFERTWNIPVAQPGDLTKPDGYCRAHWDRTAVLTCLCEQLWLRDQTLIAQGVK